jgi:hypothetical protein
MLFFEFRFHKTTEARHFVLLSVIASLMPNWILLEIKDEPFQRPRWDMY